MIKATSIMPVTRRGVNSNKRLKRGDTRPDGLVFWGYCGARERWVTPEKLKDLREKVRLAVAAHYSRNIETQRRKARERQQTPRVKLMRKAYKAREDVRERRRVLARRRLAKLRKESPEYRLSCSVRRRMSNALHGHLKADKSMVLLGCTPAELRLCLEARFELGMTWANYGSAWHVDHIIPLSTYDLTDPAQQREAFHYTNLQPLFASANMAKGDTVEGEDVVLGMLAA
jgi:hypothetical protein